MFLHLSSHISKEITYLRKRHDTRVKIGNFLEGVSHYFIEGSWACSSVVVVGLLVGVFLFPFGFYRSGNRDFFLNCIKKRTQNGSYVRLWLHRQLMKN